MATCKAKIIVGFRRDQEYTVEGDEVHKAYYLFLNPEERGIFKNGLAIVGKQIKEVLPDWNATMGWNPSHVIASDDWNEIRRSGLMRKMDSMLNAGREVAAIGTPRDIATPLSELVMKKYPQLLPSSNERRSGSVQSIGQLVAGSLPSGSSKKTHKQRHKK